MGERRQKENELALVTHWLRKSVQSINGVTHGFDLGD